MTRYLLDTNAMGDGKLDMMIAAVARTMNCTVVTSDNDFSMIAGIRTENWATS
jgi:predicted nucleic acid-binding protein